MEKLSETKNKSKVLKPDVVVVGDGIGVPNGYAPSSRLKYLAASMASNGNEVEILIARPSDFHGRALNSDTSGVVEGVRYRYLNFSPVYSSNTLIRRLQSQFGIARTVLALLIKKHGCDGLVIFAYVRNVQLLAALSAVAKFRGAKIYLELCEWQDALKTQSWHERFNNILFSKFAFRLVNGVLCISEYIETRVKSYARETQSSIVTARVPILSDRHEFDDVLPHEGSGRYFMYCGNLVYQETLEYLLRAFKRVVEFDDRVQLLIAGSSWTEEFGKRFERLVCQEGLTNRIKLLGYVSREALLAYYKGAEALVIPLFDDEVSRARFPTKISEYLFSKRPVVTTAVGEVGALLKDGVTAYVSPTDSLNDFGAAMVRALSDSNRESVGLAGYDIACQTFDFRQHGAVLNKLFIS